MVQNMVQNILHKVAKSTRTLEKKKKTEEETEDKKIMVISTYGRDGMLTKSINELEKHCEKLKFTYVKKSAPSLTNILSKSKITALGDPSGATLSCGRNRCRSCQLMSRKDYICYNEPS